MTNYSVKTHYTVASHYSYVEIVQDSYSRPNKLYTIHTTLIVRLCVVECVMVVAHKRLRVGSARPPLVTTAGVRCVVTVRPFVRHATSSPPLTLSAISTSRTHHLPLPLNQSDYRLPDWRAPS